MVSQAELESASHAELVRLAGAEATYRKEIAAALLELSSAAEAVLSFGSVVGGERLGKAVEAARTLIGGEVS